MKKCFICEKEIEDNERVCNSCIAFFEWKYGDNYLNKIKRFLREQKKNSFDNSIKSNGRYKNE